MIVALDYAAGTADVQYPSGSIARGLHMHRRVTDPYVGMRVGISVREDQAPFIVTMLPAEGT